MQGREVNCVSHKIKGASLLTLMVKNLPVIQET